MRLIKIFIVFLILLEKMEIVDTFYIFLFYTILLEHPKHITYLKTT